MSLISTPAAPPRSPGRNRLAATSSAPSSSAPVLLTTEDVATLLRTTRRAVYAMLERGQLPGIIRIGRRVLIRQDDLLDWLDQKRTPSPEE